MSYSSATSLSSLDSQASEIWIKGPLRRSSSTVSFTSLHENVYTKVWKVRHHYHLSVARNLALKLFLSPLTLILCFCSDVLICQAINYFNCVLLLFLQTLLNLSVDPCSQVSEMAQKIVNTVTVKVKLLSAFTLTLIAVLKLIANR